MEKNILILCCGYPYACDTGFGFHVAKALEKTKLPENVEFLEVGGSACMVPAFVEGKDKLIVIDFFQLDSPPGTVVRLLPEEVPLAPHGRTDIDKFHLFEMLEQIRISGKCPEAIFIGVVPKDLRTPSEKLTPEIEKRIPEVIALILKEVS
ncbi:MAG: hydrogenase maturation protease [Thermodesulfovibrionales bacterium]|nr:hydrogenase maturation protease [Thermodesulfovibrionales bacterium]